jgi:hypothetical protein
MTDELECRRLRMDPLESESGDREEGSMIGATTTTVIAGMDSATREGGLTLVNLASDGLCRRRR